MKRWWCLAVVLAGMPVGCGGESNALDTSGTGSDTGGDAQPPPIPAACENAGLPTERGQETQAGHFTTAGDFGVDILGELFGETFGLYQPVLVLATHEHYDCDRPLDFSELMESDLFAQQVIYAFPGDLEVGTYRIPDDARAWAVTYLGDGQGNGGGSEGDLSAGSIEIVSVEDACVTGIKPFSPTAAYGFAVSTKAGC